MSGSKNTGNVSCFPAQNSDNGAGAHIDGEDAPENRQDLVVVTLSRAEAFIVQAFVRTHLIARLKYGWGNAPILERIIAAVEAAQPPPDQGEHVAQFQEGERTCISCSSLRSKVGWDPVDSLLNPHRWACGNCGLENDL
jgi:hypothetical protein